jgi:gentisate 1,2-dioxygenase
MAAENVSPELEQFYSEIENDSLQGLWRVVKGMARRSPDSPAVAHHWSWRSLRAHLQRASQLVKIERGSDRRVLLLVNPGLKDRHLTTPTLIGSLQIIRPGEIAPAHRHSAAAIRFVVEGRGAFSAVQGERVYVEEKDLVLTPSMSWHNHGNETPDPIIWMDGISAPLMHYLSADFYDDYPAEEQALFRPDGYSRKKYGAGILRPSSEHATPDSSPLWHYRWEDTQRALRNLAEVEHDPFDGVMLDYVNPLTGRHALPSIACRIQLLPAGMTTQTHRHTGHWIYHVAEGSGATTIEGVRYEWTHGDFFLVPPWRWHQHEATPGTDAVLFSMSDTPLLEALGVHREEAMVDDSVAVPVETRERVTV